MIRKSQKIKKNEIKIQDLTFPPLSPTGWPYLQKRKVEGLKDACIQSYMYSFQVKDASYILSLGGIQKVHELRDSPFQPVEHGAKVVLGNLVDVSKYVVDRRHLAFCCQ